jgi:nucleoside 2-deoxyribosyltransferase
MKLIYIATRLYSAHSRLQGLELSKFLEKVIKEKMNDLDIQVFLPYRDSNNLVLNAHNKSKLIYELDVEKLNSTDILIGFLDNPFFDSGIGFEIGYCFFKNTPTLLLNSSFNDIQYNDGKEIYKFDIIADYVCNIITNTTAPSSLPFEKAQNEIISILFKNVENCLIQKQYFKKHNRIKPKEKFDLFIDFCGDKYEWCSYLFERLKQFLHDNKIKFYYRNKEDSAEKVINFCNSSRIILLCGDGVDMDFGSAILQGIARANNKTIILYYSGIYSWHYSDLSINIERNIMIKESADYICDSIYSIESVLYHLKN